MQGLTTRIARVAAVARGCLPQPRPSPPATRDDRLGHGELGVHRRAVRLRVRAGWGRGGRTRHCHPDDSGCSCRSSDILTRRSIRPETRDDRFGRRAGRAHGARGVDDLARRSVRGRVLHRRGLERDEHGVPASRGGAASLAGPNPRRTDGCERRDEHRDLRRRVRRPCSRGIASCRNEHPLRVRDQRRVVPLVGGPCSRGAQARRTDRPRAG